MRVKKITHPEPDISIELNTREAKEIASFIGGSSTSSRQNATSDRYDDDAIRDLYCAIADYFDNKDLS